MQTHLQIGQLVVVQNAQPLRVCSRNGPEICQAVKVGQHIAVLDGQIAVNVPHIGEEAQRVDTPNSTRVGVERAVNVHVAAHVGA